MLIKEITFCNFRQYKGNQTISFSTDENHNVTLICGTNGTGKTTIAQAFKWCLYGYCDYVETEIPNSDYVNDLTPKERGEVYVTTIIIHQDKEYTIRRTLRFHLRDDWTFRKNDIETRLKVQYKDENGEQKSIDYSDGQSEINKILPEDLSDYFFFDGERIAKIDNSKDVKSAVRGIMGLDTIAKACEHFDPKRASSVTSKFRDAMARNTDQKGQLLAKELEAKQKLLEEKNDRLSNTEKEIVFYEEKKDKLSKEISANKELGEKQAKRKKLENNIEIIKKQIEDAKKRFKTDFSSEVLCFFAVPLVKRAIEVTQNADLSGEGIPDMQSSSIDAIIKRDYCICGTKLSTNQGALDCVKKEQSLLPPNHIGTTLRIHREKFENLIARADGFLSKIQDDNVRILAASKDLINTENELKELSEEIGNADEIDVSKLNAEYNNAYNSLQEKKSLKDRLNREIGSLEKEIGDLEKKIDELVNESKKNKEIQKYYEYSKAIYEWFAEGYVRRENEIKTAIHDCVNKIYNEIQIGGGVLHIDDNYHIDVLANTSGKWRNIKAENMGELTIKNFSFIAGLIELAKEKAMKATHHASDEDEMDKDIEPFPVVMDAPFSNLGTFYTEKVSRILPQIAEQVIVIIYEDEVAENALKDRVGKRYLIETVGNSKTYSIVKEEE